MVEMGAESTAEALALAQAMAADAGAIAATVIPAGPGMVGTFQAAVAGGLSLFAPNAGERAFAFANVLWLVQIVQQTALGVVFLFSRHIKIASIFAAPREVEEGLESEEADYRRQDAASNR